MTYEKGAEKREKPFVYMWSKKSKKRQALALIAYSDSNSTLIPPSCIFLQNQKSKL
jgi:hypothetical protein